MIVHADYTFPVVLYGTPLWSPWQRPISQKTWFGVSGALTLVGAFQTRECVVEATLTNYALFAQIETASDGMASAAELPLYGRLVFSPSVFYERCLFLGWEPNAPPFFDGSGQHGWTQMGKLKWQQTR
ncbi:MAG: hypothetical protein KDB01_11465 [Planctomycetaceae bacterium]|nr:hypothetical protein [Planctomycetaceae bacterium]